MNWNVASIETTSIVHKLGTEKFKFYLTSGMGAFNPGILRLGYEGGGPYLCMAINHGGGTKLLLGPIGIPRAVLKSSDKSPGFFSFNLVSNSLPWKT